MKNIIQSLALFAFIVFFVSSCCKDKNENPEPLVSSMINISVAGSLINYDDYQIFNANVKIGNTTIAVDWNGIFYFPDVTVNKKRFVISVNENGYFTTYRSYVPNTGEPVICNIGLMSQNSQNSSTHTFSTTQTDSVQFNNGSKIIFPANAFSSENGTTYSGNATVKACYYDPTLSDYGIYSIGGDLYGKDINDNDVMLDPIAGISIFAYDDSGNELKLKSSSNAEIKLFIPTQTTAPNIAKTWYFDTEQGLRIEKGTAQKSNGFYNMQISSLGYWSCENSFTGKAKIWGYARKIINGDSIGVNGLNILVGKQVVITDKSGKYEAFVPDNIDNMEVVPILGAMHFNPQIVSPALQNNDCKRLDIIIKPSNANLISGKVINSLGNPIENALIYVKWPKLYTPIYYKSMTFTNNNGYYFLPVDATSYRTEVGMKFNALSSGKNLNIYGDTTCNFIFPSSIGSTSLFINGLSIFNVNAYQNNPGNTIYGSFDQNIFNIDANIKNSGRFIVFSNNNIDFNYEFPIIIVNQEYNIPNEVTAFCKTQQMSDYYTIVNGHIVFTKYGLSSGTLTEGVVSGVGKSGYNVEFKFSLPSSFKSLKKK